MEQNEAFDITITFDEEVTGFQATALTIDVETEVPAAGVGAATATLKSEVLGGEIYMVTITPTPIFEGDVTITVKKPSSQTPPVISIPLPCPLPSTSTTLFPRSRLQIYLIPSNLKRFL